MLLWSYKISWAELGIQTETVRLQLQAKQTSETNYQLFKAKILWLRNSCLFFFKKKKKKLGGSTKFWVKKFMGQNFIPLGRALHCHFGVHTKLKQIILNQTKPNCQQRG